MKHRTTGRNRHNQPLRGEAQRRPWKEVPPDPTAAMADVLPAILKRLGVMESVWTRALTDEWPALVGPEVARHTRPGQFNRAHLVVFVESSVWLSELSRFGKKPMLEKIAKRFGSDKVRTLSFQLDPDGARPRS